MCVERKYIDVFTSGKDNLLDLIYHDYSDKHQHHFVLWSGGTDSTLLLYELLQKYGSNHVTAVSFEPECLLSMKIKNENASRELFKLYCDRLGDHYYQFRHFTLTMSYKSTGMTGPFHLNAGYGQSVFWLSLASVYSCDNAYIYTGAIKDDDLTFYTNQASYQKFFEGINGLLKKNLILREPYLMMEKYKIIIKLIEYDLFDMTWTCENPSEYNVPCKRCKPCITQYNALTMIDKGKIDNVSDKVRLKVKEILEKYNTIKEKEYVPEEIKLID